MLKSVVQIHLPPPPLPNPQCASTAGFVFAALKYLPVTPGHSVSLAFTPWVALSCCISSSSVLQLASALLPDTQRSNQLDSLNAKASGLEPRKQCSPKQGLRSTATRHLAVLWTSGSFKIAATSPHTEWKGFLDRAAIAGQNMALDFPGELL